MAFRKLRKSWIQWTVLGIGEFAITAAVVLAFIAFFVGLSEEIGSSSNLYNNTVNISGDYYLPLNATLSDTESLVDCSLVIESINNDDATINYQYTIITENDYELYFSIGGLREYTYVNIDGNDIELYTIYNLEPGHHTINFKIKYEFNTMMHYPEPNIFSVKLSTILNGKPVNTNVSMSEDVAKEYYFVSQDTFSYNIQKNGFELNPEKEEKSTAKILIGISMGCVCYLGLLIVFEIVLGIGAYIEKNKEKNELNKVNEKKENSEDRTIEI